MKVARGYGFALCAALLIMPGTVEAQDPSTTPPTPPQPPVETELVFDREVFSYPAFTRRNPFRALLAADSGGPRYEQLTLIGIMFSPDRAASVAVLTTGGVALNEDGTTSPLPGDAYYVMEGESIGNVTVTSIQRDRVEVLVSEFDDQVQRTMSIASRLTGGSP